MSSDVTGGIQKTETFSSFNPIAPIYNWAPNPGGYNSQIGNYKKISGNSKVQLDDTYGANQGNYMSLEKNSKVRLTFNSPQNYFGFAWPAGDNLNEIKIIRNNVVIGTFSTADVIAKLPNNNTKVTALNGSQYTTKDYYGKPPSRILNTGEPYAYLHFIASAGLAFDEIEFVQGNSSGEFENDNHTILTNGTPVAQGKWVELISVKAPKANNDSGIGINNNPVTVNVLANDTPGDNPIKPSTVQINGTTSAASPLVVPGEGTWSVNATTGAITFTPLPSFTGNPTPIQYSVQDTKGYSSNLATVALTYLTGPTAVDDLASTQINTPVGINVIQNDIIGSNPINPASVSFVPGTAPSPSKGVFTVNPVTGLVTFTPANGFTGEATIDYQVCDVYPLCDVATITVKILKADVMITKTASSNTPQMGSNITFTLTAKNNGPDEATNVVVNDALPSGYTFVSATPSTGTWSAPNWNIGTLAKNATATLDIVATVKTTGTYQNTATISATEYDPTPGNNSSSVTPVPVPVADLSVTKTASNMAPIVGTNVTFTITAKNNGPVNATGVKVNDVLPSGYTFVNATPSVGTWSAPNWTIGNLADGASATLTIVATVKSSGNYENTAAISGNQTDPTPGNNSSTSTPVPVAAADLSVTKVANNNAPVVGSQVTFTITAKNNGPSNATGVKVNDALPSGYTFVSATPSVGTWSAPNWTIGSLANGATATMTVKATVNASGDYTNTAAISGDQTDPTPGNNSSTSTPVPVGAADLSVTKVADNNNPAVGTQVTFTITAKNNGPSNATGVKVNDALPSGYTFVSATPSVGTWSAPNWTIGSLANGATATMTVKATVNASGDYTNTAAISGDQTDPTPGNNSSSVTPSPSAVADLSVTKVADNNAPVVGSQVTFTITAKNNGPSNATGVKVNDALPSGYTFVSATPSVGTWSAPNWTIGSLANGATATMTVKATVNASGDYTNTAAISGDQTDPTPGNNSSSVTPSPSAVADLSVTKTLDKTNPHVGETVVFTITAKNNGPSAASGVVVNDQVPAGFTVTNSSVSAGTWTAPNWNIGNLANGASATLTLTATVNSGGLYSNTASITGNQNDPNSANNSATATAVPGPKAVDDNASTTLNTPVNILILTNDLQGAGALNPASVTFVGTLPNPATVGTFTKDNAGTVTFTPAFGFTGTATVDYQVCDANALCDVATITVVVNSVAGPDAKDDTAATDMNTPVDINVLANDLPGAKPLVPSTVQIVPGTEPNPTTQGSFTVNPTTGLVTFTPVNGFTGTVTSSYKVCDQNALCDVATITVVVNSVAGPDAFDDVASTVMNTPVEIDVLANDLPGVKPIVPSTVQIVPGTEPNPTTQGSFTVNPTTGLVTFTPANGFTGTVTADYQVCDQNALCDVATITVVVNSVAGPDAKDDTAATDMNTPVDINVLANDLPGAKPLVPSTVQIVPGTEPNPTTQGSFTVNPTTGLVTFTPVNGFTGTVTSSYKVCDQNALCDVATITVVVNSVAEPDAFDDVASTVMNTPVEIDVLANDLPGVKPIVPSTVQIVPGTEPNPVTEGSFTVDPLTGMVTFTPVNGFIGTVHADYKVCDQNGLCDVAKITVNIIPGTDILYPALGFGTLAFEDLWPAKGDYDFNDLVLDYQFRILINTSNKVQKVTGTFIIRAFGATFENGFGFQLPQTVNPADLTVSGYELSESFINLDGNGTESGQNAPTIIVYDNAYNQMPHPGVGIGVNTTPGAPYVTPDTLTITIDFKPNAVSFNELDISNFNPFLIVNKVRGHEVHLPGYKPTALVNTALFGQDDDDTKPTNGKYYVTNNNLPWAINIYEKFDYPIEKQDILAVHLKFAEWATSGGVLFPDWYKNLNGYRNNALIYQVPPTNP
ncbi:hypothetical protein MASR2M12_07830 [Bacteroidales bacterium]